MASVRQAPNSQDSLEAEEKGLTKGTPTSQSQPKPVEGLDERLIAWIQCAGAFFLFFNSWGVVNTFGTHS